MSRHAYRVIKLEFADASFNIYDEQSLVDFLDGELDGDGSFYDDGGYVDVPVSLLRKALRQSGQLNLSETTITHIKNDIKFAKLNHDETVLYNCF